MGEDMPETPNSRIGPPWFWTYGMGDDTVPYGWLYDLQVSFNWKTRDFHFLFNWNPVYTNFESMKTNLPLEEREFLFFLFCSSGTHRVIFGEILNLKDSTQSWCKQWNKWIQMVSKHRHMTSRESTTSFECSLCSCRWMICTLWREKMANNF